MNKEKMKHIAWENSNYCDCCFDDCHPNNHRICYICGDKMLWGSYWANIEQRNSRYAWDIDHRISLNNEGTNNPNNLFATHVHCNRKKGKL